MEKYIKDEDYEDNQNYLKTLEEVEQFNAEHIFVEDDDVLQTAKKAFGVEYLFPWQRLVISNIMDSFKDQNSIEVKKLEEKNKVDSDFSDAFCLGRQIVLLPTGAGKSMCFLVPSIMLPGPTLIIYPLLGLMADQERRMKDGSINAVTFRGGQSEQEREENFKKLDAGAKIILANPEVLQNKNLVERLKKYSISHIAIDEAHCVSEWGDSFRPAYLELGKIILALGVKIVTAFTATASSTVLARIAEVLFENNAHIVRSESDRPNIHYHLHYAYAKQKEVLRLCKTSQRPILIFCGTREKSEQMARELSDYFCDDNVRFYHAGLSKEEKTKVEKWYFPHENAILCSTCAFGMGIDKANIRTVIHLEASSTAESYIQEAGRGGRDRKDSDAILLWNYDDVENFSKFSNESRQSVIRNFAMSNNCRRQVLLDALGGEKAICSGCDVCNAKKENRKLKDLDNAEDATFVLKFIKMHNKMYSKNALVPLLKSKFNKKDRDFFKMNVWTENDVKTIISQLEKQEKIKINNFPWKDKIGIAKAKVKAKTSSTN